jgi:HSP20 family protein
MAIIRWYDYPEESRSLRALDQLQREMNRLMADMNSRSSARSNAGVFPPVNIAEDAQNLYVRAELPGMKPDELEISVEGDTLTFRGERKLVEAGEGVNYHRRERESGRFRRIMTLPVKIDPDGVSASFKNGVLGIVMPKAKEVLPKRIKVESQG